MEMTHKEQGTIYLHGKKFLLVYKDEGIQNDKGETILTTSMRRFDGRELGKGIYELKFTDFQDAEHFAKNTWHTD